MFIKQIRKGTDDIEAGLSNTEQSRPSRDNPADLQSSASTTGRRSFGAGIRLSPVRDSKKNAKEKRYATADDFMARFGFMVEVPNLGKPVRPKLPEIFDPPLIQMRPADEALTDETDWQPREHVPLAAAQHVLDQERMFEVLLQRFKDDDGKPLEQRFKKDFEAIMPLPEAERIAACQELISRYHAELTDGLNPSQ